MRTAGRISADIFHAPMTNSTILFTAKSPTKVRTPHFFILQIPVYATSPITAPKTRYGEYHAPIALAVSVNAARIESKSVMNPKIQITVMNHGLC